MYSNTQRRHWHEQEKAPFHGGFQEASSAGGAAGARHGAGDRARYEVHPNQVSTWKRQAMEGLAEIFSRPALKRDEEHEAKVRELHAKIGELTVERDFFLRGLAR